jgi:hypothetical protein
VLSPSARARHHHYRSEARVSNYVQLERRLQYDPLHLRRSSLRHLTRSEGWTKEPLFPLDWPQCIVTRSASSASTNSRNCGVNKYLKESLLRIADKTRWTVAITTSRLLSRHVSGTCIYPGCQYMANGWTYIGITRTAVKEIGIRDLRLAGANEIMSSIVLFIFSSAR